MESLRVALVVCFHVGIALGVLHRCRVSGIRIPGYQGHIITAVIFTQDWMNIITFDEHDGFSRKHRSSFCRRERSIGRLKLNVIISHLA